MRPPAASPHQPFAPPCPAALEHFPPDDTPPVASAASPAVADGKLREGPRSLAAAPPAAALRHHRAGRRATAQRPAGLARCPGGRAEQLRHRAAHQRARPARDGRRRRHLAEFRGNRHPGGGLPGAGGHPRRELHHRPWRRRYRHAADRAAGVPRAAAADPADPAGAERRDPGAVGRHLPRAAERRRGTRRRPARRPGGRHGRGRAGRCRRHRGAAALRRGRGAGARAAALRRRGWPHHRRPRAQPAAGQRRPADAGRAARPGRAFDVDQLAGQSYALLPVTSGDARDFAAALQDALRGQGGRQVEARGWRQPGRRGAGGADAADQRRAGGLGPAQRDRPGPAGLCPGGAGAAPDPARLERLLPAEQPQQRHRLCPAAGLHAAQRHGAADPRGQHGAGPRERGS